MKQYGDYIAHKETDSVDEMCKILLGQALQVFKALGKEPRDFTIEFYHGELEKPNAQGYTTETHKTGWIATLKDVVVSQ